MRRTSVHSLLSKNSGDNYPAYILSLFLSPFFHPPFWWWYIQETWASNHVERILERRIFAYMQEMARLKHQLSSISQLKNLNLPFIHFKPIFYSSPVFSFSLHLIIKSIIFLCFIHCTIIPSSSPQDFIERRKRRAASSFIRCFSCYSQDKMIIT